MEAARLGLSSLVALGWHHTGWAGDGKTTARRMEP